MKALRLTLAFLLLVVVTRSGDFVSGSASCATSGVAQVSTTSYNLYQITVQAKTTNTGVIFVGGPTVTTASGGGLVAGASYNANKPSAGINPTALYFACTVNSDAVTWVGSR